MLTFLIDTSTERGLVALVNGQEVLREMALELRGSHNQLLFPAIEALFSECGITSDKIERIGVGVGPGSYTGIRVAATIAKTLAFARQIPLVGVPTLMTLQPTVDGLFAAVIDARIGGFYVHIGEQQAEQTRYVTESRLVSLDEANRLLQQIPHIISPYIAPIKRRLSEYSGTSEEQGPNASQMAALVQQLYDQGHYSADGQLDLLYLRKTQAELEKKDNC